MNLKKLLLYGLGVLLVCVAAFFLIGIISTLLFYAFIASLFVIAGVIAYKFLARSKKPALEGNLHERQIAYAEQDLAETQKLLDSYKQKLLVEKKNQ